MRRTFGVDVLACPRCGGRLRLVALIDQASVIQRILRHLGLPTDVPEPRPARPPPCTVDPIEDQSHDVPESDAACLRSPPPRVYPRCRRGEGCAASAKERYAYSQTALIFPIV